jgi:hypothetical protein
LQVANASRFSSGVMPASAIAASVAGIPVTTCDLLGPATR